MKRFVVIALCALMVLGITAAVVWFARYDAPVDEPVLAEDGSPTPISCRLDSDCLHEYDGCCGATLGGTCVVMNKDAKAAVSARCANSICPQVISPTCKGKVRCIKGECVLM